MPECGSDVENFCNERCLIFVLFSSMNSGSGPEFRPSDSIIQDSPHDPKPRVSSRGVREDLGLEETHNRYVDREFKHEAMRRELRWSIALNRRTRSSLQ
jgi:hypothetical protein